MKTLMCALLPCLFIASVCGKEVGKLISELPETIKAEKGQLTLHADFSSKRPDGRIPVYLINRTKLAITLNAQDGDVYLKLEAQSKTGEWVRAQRHSYSWCGNSYDFSPKIEPGSFIKILGYQPSQGRKQKVRFSLYNQSVSISSNVGLGLASDKDITESTNDELARVKHKRAE